MLQVQKNLKTTQETSIKCGNLKRVHLLYYRLSTAVIKTESLQICYIWVWRTLPLEEGRELLKSSKFLFDIEKKKKINKCILGTN